jgi:hypothetical protein
MPDLGHGAVGNGRGPAGGAKAVRGRGLKDYVVDAGYPKCPGYLAPYKGERYHISERHRGAEPNTPTKRFNRAHSSIRNVIERSFGLLKMK